MSIFFKALEQAERERAQKEARPTEVSTPSAGSTPPQEATAPALAISRALGGPSVPPVPERPVSRPGIADLKREPSLLSWKEIDDHLVSFLDPASFAAEQYRTLRHTVEQLHRSAELSVFAVSSPGGGDGKTLTAVNLAGALSQAPAARVLVMDLDLRHASLAHRLGLHDAEARGLVDVILDPGLALDDVVRRRPPYNLSVLVAGRLSGSPYEVLKSPRLGELLDQARARYDYIVLDTPPVVAVPDCRIIGKWVDGFLVVVTAHRTPRWLVEETLNVIEASQLIGFVFNEDDHPLAGYGTAYGYRLNADRAGWWGRAAKTLSNSLRRGSPA